MENNKFTRKELYDMVWKEPLTKLSESLNIPYTSLRSIYKEMDIPIPSGGYWYKVKSGKNAEKTPLPENYEGKNEINLSDLSEENSPNGKKNSLQDEIIKNQNLSLKVPEKIAKYDKMVLKAKETLTRSISEYRNSKFHRTHQDDISIEVTKDNIERSLRFMDTLIKLMRERGHDVFVKEGKTIVKVFGEEIPIRLREKTKMTKIKSEYSFYNTEYSPTGLLIFVIDIRSYKRKEWVDGKILIENRLADILSFIETFAKQEIQDRNEREKENKIWKENRKKEEELLRIKQEEFEKVKKFINNANYWKQAHVLREYIAAIEANNDEDKHSKDWIAWAKQKIEWFDPFSLSPDEILTDQDRENLFEELSETDNQSRNSSYYSRRNVW